MPKRTVKLPETKAPAERDSLLPAVSVVDLIKKCASFKRLSRSEEQQLAVRYLKQNDIDAARKLVMSNLWLVVKIAKEYQRSAHDLSDLVQEGVVGLLEAVRNFDPFKGVRFPTYAVFWIKAYIIKFILDNYRLVKLGTNQVERRLFFGFSKDRKAFEDSQNSNLKQLADRYGTSEEQILEIKHRLTNREVSLNEAINPEGLTVEEVVPDRSSDVEEEVFKREFAQQIRKSLDLFARSLPERERQVFYRRVLGENKDTLQELSDSLGVSIERVRQIESKIKDSLKQFLFERFKDEILASD